ncbi:MAG TPA: AAA family ATPase [Chitinophagaceae bacterium]|jgi:HTH-type transcriptional repressor of NAD biosynthesis genes|nr:AAA family ATPase [Chitinophagaceae bacterium]
MKRGLVLGKFLPLHEGHLGLIRFALGHCDELVVLLCTHPGEPIPAGQRMDWLTEALGGEPRIRLVHYRYDPALLTDASAYDPEGTAAWASALRNILPPVQVVFTSEAYGPHLAGLLEAGHFFFNDRTLFPVSGTAIRAQPLAAWDYLPACVRPYFVKTVCLSGSESTGKSTLAARLAAHFDTVYVPEKARELLAHTQECTLEHLHQIARAQAEAGRQARVRANRLLIWDTGLHVTRSYAGFLFNTDLAVPDWVEEANRFDLHLFLDTDCPFVQDGTRLEEAEREALGRHHEATLQRSGVPYIRIGGTWEERFRLACHHIEQLLNT